MDTPLFEYHTFSHHSQTLLKPVKQSESLNTIHFYIILKLLTLIRSMQIPFEYHTFLHHSQTCVSPDSENYSLNTIHFYIILKLVQTYISLLLSLNTIHFYIILKLELGSDLAEVV